MQIKNATSKGLMSLSNAAVVVGSSIIYSQDFSEGYTLSPFNREKEYLPEEIAMRLSRSITGNTAEFHFTNPPSMIGRIRSEVIPFNTIHPYNYFHFLIESLPSLLQLQRHGYLTKSCVVATGNLHRNMKVVLDLIFRDKQPSILQMNLLQYIECDKVIAAPDSFYGAELLNSTLGEFIYDKENILHLRSIFKALWSDSSASPNRKIFIRRLSATRNLINIHKLEDLAVAAGYQVIVPENLDFIDQVRIFSSASHICGPTGAWIANLVFAPDGTNVSVLSPDISSPSASLWQSFGDTLGVNLMDVFCPIFQLNPRQPIHSDYSMSESAFNELLMH